MDADDLLTVTYVLVSCRNAGTDLVLRHSRRVCVHLKLGREAPAFDWRIDVVVPPKNNHNSSLLAPASAGLLPVRLDQFGCTETSTSLRDLIAKMPGDILATARIVVAKSIIERLVFLGVLADFSHSLSFLRLSQVLIKKEDSPCGKSS